MDILLRKHGSRNRYVLLRTETGTVTPCHPSQEGPAGWAYRLRGIWYAGYRYSGVPSVQIGRSAWPLERLVQNSFEQKGWFRKLTLQFESDSGVQSVEVRYLRPLSSFLDGNLDEDDEISSDFFLWLHLAIKDRWLERWGDAERPERPDPG